MMRIRPCWVEICTGALEENYRFLVSVADPHAELLAIVKADAYGHSLALCAPVLAQAGARWLGVTSVEEAVAARAVCAGAQILVIGSAFPGQGADVVHSGLTPVAWEQFQLSEIESAARAAECKPGSLPVHIEIDTGMSRQGSSLENLPALLARFTPDSPLQLDGVMTHLFAADESNGIVTRKQMAQLEDALLIVARTGLRPQWLNVGSSAALLGGQAPSIAALAERFEMKSLIRPGLALYGVAPEFTPPPEGTEPELLAQVHRRLRPVLTWKAKIATVRSIPAGAVVGYNGTFVASEPMQLALLPVGYADGLDRKLGNGFSLLVNGRRAPLVGRISMDHAVLDVTEMPDVVPGDEVVILGSQGAETVAAFEHAKATGTIPWEVFTRIGARVPRFAV